MLHRGQHSSVTWRLFLVFNQCRSKILLFIPSSVKFAYIFSICIKPRDQPARSTVTDRHPLKQGLKVRVQRCLFHKLKYLEMWAFCTLGHRSLGGDLNPRPRPLWSHAVSRRTLPRTRYTPKPPRHMVFLLI